MDYISSAVSFSSSHILDKHLHLSHNIVLLFRLLRLLFQNVLLQPGVMLPNDPLDSAELARLLLNAHGVCDGGCASSDDESWRRLFWRSLPSRRSQGRAGSKFGSRFVFPCASLHCLCNSSPLTTTGSCTIQILRYVLFVRQFSRSLQKALHLIHPSADNTNSSRGWKRGCEGQRRIPAKDVGGAAVQPPKNRLNTGRILPSSHSIAIFYPCYQLSAMPRIMRAVALLALLAVPIVHAQADLPDLATVTGVTSTSDAETTATSDATTAGTTATSTGDDDQTSTTETDSAATTSATSDADESTTSGTAATTTATFPDASTSTAAGTFSLSDLPTIAGAGVPTLVIPYTAAAPFMQKSTMPEGTVFIAVGAVLAFMGACVLLWRGLVAWSINRSVKRAALASIRGPEKSGAPGWKSGAGYGVGKHAYNKEYENGSSMSLDALTSAGKPIKPFKDDHDRRQSSAPQQGLFFSPTAQASNRASSAAFDNRSSTYLPAGYYAAPADGVAGGRTSTVGGSLAPYARHSALVNPSPPHSPGMPGSRATSAQYGSRDGLRQNDALRASSRDGRATPLSRDGYGGNDRSSFLYQQPSSSSLAVGTGGNSTGEHMSGQRAPSAVLDDLFQNHGRMNQGS